MRLFVALDLPEAVRSALAAWRPNLPGARWTPAERMHVTLRFLGETPPEAAERIQDHLVTFAASAVPVRTAGLVRLPSARRPHVLAVRLEESPALADLAGRLGAVLKKAGVPPEERPLLPHVTLARFRTPDGAAIRRFLRAASPPEAAGVAESVSLVHSRRGEGGPVYSTLARAPLT